MWIISRQSQQIKVGGLSKLCLATSQTQFGLTSNLLENFFSEFENFGENFSKIPGEIPKICQKIEFL